MWQGCDIEWAPQDQNLPVAFCSLYGSVKIHIFTQICSTKIIFLLCCMKMEEQVVVVEESWSIDMKQ